MAKKPTKEQFRAWRNARAQNYVHTRSPSALATMVVELEDEYGCPPEFEIDGEWPSYVRGLRRG